MANGLRLLRYKNRFKEISKNELEIEAKSLICDYCQNEIFLPQHHGRDMIPKGEKLICWRNMVESEEIEPCEEEFPLTCPRCQKMLVSK
jgi:hypothetical protein